MESGTLAVFGKRDGSTAPTGGCHRCRFRGSLKPMASLRKIERWKKNFQRCRIWRKKREKKEEKNLVSMEFVDENKEKSLSHCDDVGRGGRTLEGTRGRGEGISSS